MSVVKRMEIDVEIEIEIEIARDKDRESVMLLPHPPFLLAIRFGFDRRFGNGKKTRHVGSPPPSVASPTMCGQKRDHLSDPNLKVCYPSPPPSPLL